MHAGLSSISSIRYHWGIIGSLIIISERVFAAELYKHNKEGYA